MIFEIQKAILVPISSYPEDAPREEFWQPVGQRHTDRDEALKELKRFREWNEGKGLHYRLVGVVEEVRE